jgi:hypothetical protein
MQSSAPAPGAQSAWDSSLGAIEDSISQCPFLQMTYTAETQHTDGINSPGARPRYRPPSHLYPHATSRTHDNRMDGRQTSCCQQTAPPMSQHISVCPVPACRGEPPSGRSGFSSPLRDRIFSPSTLLHTIPFFWCVRGHCTPAGTVL